MDKFSNIKEALTDRRTRLAELLGRVEVSARRRFDKSLEEQAIQRENEEILTHIDDSLNLEFLQIERALARLESGEYGFCENCGGQIAMNRLEAIPQTSFCLKCAE